MLEAAEKILRWWRASRSSVVTKVDDADSAVQEDDVDLDRTADRLSIDISGDPQASALTNCCATALSKALSFETRLPDELFNLDGMSGRKYRLWINNLISAIPDARYLEIGSWMGSTACSAMAENQVRVLCIDNWSEFGGPKEAFFSNVARFLTDKIKFKFYESDFRTVDYHAIGTYNVFLFDGPHGEQDQCDGLMLTFPSLDEEFVFIVDDWNAPFVRVGTYNALKAAGVECLYRIEIRTTHTDEHALKAYKESDWHNGYHIGVYRKVNTPNFKEM